MRQALKTQWYLMLRTIEFKLAFSLVTALTLFSYLSEVVSCWGAEISTIKTASDQCLLQCQYLPGLSAVFCDRSALFSLVCGGSGKPGDRLLSVKVG